MLLPGSHGGRVMPPRWAHSGSTCEVPNCPGCFHCAAEGAAGHGPLHGPGWGLPAVKREHLAQWQPEHDDKNEEAVLGAVGTGGGK